MRVGSTWNIDSIPGRSHILNYLIQKYKFKTAIDVGCGKGDFFKYLNDKKVNVEGTGIDMMDDKDLIYKDFNYVNCNFSNYESDETYDLIFSSHTIEHNPDTESFIKNFFKLGDDKGLFCLIWPPPKPLIVGGHVHIFNLGLMLYNIIRTGIDCSKVEIFKSGYNLCIMGEYKKIEIKELTYNRFEIDILKKYFPFNARQAFDGDNPPGVKKLN